MHSLGRKSNICSLTWFAKNPRVWSTEVSLSEHGSLTERVMLAKNFLRASSSLAISGKMGEQAENDIFEPVDVYRALLYMEKLLRGLLRDLLNRLKLLRRVREQPIDD